MKRDPSFHDDEPYFGVVLQQHPAELVRDVHLLLEEGHGHSRVRRTAADHGFLKRSRVSAETWWNNNNPL